MFRDEKLVTNGSPKVLNSISKNSVNNFCEDLLVNSCNISVNKVNNCSVVCKKGKRKFTFVCNKIKVFTCFLYKHARAKRIKLWENTLNKINKILYSQGLSLKGDSGSYKLSQAIAYALAREDFHLAHLIEGLRHRIGKLAHLQTRKYVPLICLYSSALCVACFSAIPIFRKMREYKVAGDDALADIGCVLRQLLHQVKRSINGVVWSVWKHVAHPPHRISQLGGDRRSNKIGESTRSVMQISGAVVVSGHERVAKVRELLRLEHLSSNQFRDIESLLIKFSDRFYISGDVMPATNVIEHEIPTTSNIPIRIKQFRHPPVLKEEINR